MCVKSGSELGNVVLPRLGDPATRPHPGGPAAWPRVIPAKAGIHVLYLCPAKQMDSRLRGNDGVAETKVAHE